ncbi:MAG TPA: OmpA family protein [Bryobacteraceae bacterium]|nr:OmpA family protein [Bryobacteraceae bacterium]
MKRTFFQLAIVGLWCTLPAVSQPSSPQPANKPDTAPLYQVTVVDRNVDAVNYQYRSGPTKIDFRGTVLLDHAKGDATVESKRGRTEIDARFDNLEPPSRFGREYLTYVLWAITPEGAPHNLGEIVADSGNHGHLRVTTDLQVFGMIVTAEPFSPVRQPSNVVVLENHIRPDTLGSTQPIQAKYELLPRGSYTYDVQQGLQNAVRNAPKVSMRQYEALLELYEAQNAVNIAQADNAGQLAPNTFAKARHALQEAQNLQASKADSNLVVQHAREAAEMAEDARVIAGRRKQEDQLAAAQNEVAQAKAQAREAKAEALAEVQRAKEQADAARAQAEQANAALQRAQSDAAAARVKADRYQSVASAPAPPPPPAASQEALGNQQKEVRGQLLERLNGEVETRDTPRGLVVVVGDADFTGATLRPEAADELNRVAAIIASHPGLHVSVEGNADSAGSVQLSSDRASAVRSALVAGGLPAASVTSQGLGNARPETSNATEKGRVENRRVEIVISGDPIGSMPFWDRTYSLAPHR